jgi:hypothetical protein
MNVASVGLLEHAVLRAAAWPIEAISAFAAPELALAAHAVMRAEHEVARRQGLVVEALHAAVPTIDLPEVRWYVLAVKRHVHAGLLQLPTPSAPVEAGLSRYSHVEELIAEERRVRENLARIRMVFERQHRAELSRQRRALDSCAREGAFRKALLISGGPIADRWEETIRRPREPRHRQHRLERTLFRYLLRAVGRPTPHGAWAGVAPVSLRLTRDDGGLIHRKRPARFEATVDLQPFKQILGALAASPRYRQRGSLRLNPTLHRVQAGWRFEHRTSESYRWKTLNWSADVQEVLEEFGHEDLSVSNGNRPTSIASRLELRPRDAIVNRLLDQGILIVDLSLPTSASTVWAALDSVAPRLLNKDRPRWIGAVHRIHGLCDDMSARYHDANTEEVAKYLHAILEEVEALRRWSGTPADPRTPVVHLDMRLPLDATWECLLYSSVAVAVRELLAFHSREGSAERDRLARIRGLPITTGEVPLLPLLADWASGPSVESTRPLLPEERRTFERESEPGPGGSLLIRLGKDPMIWIGPGCPQPGMFATRYSSILADDPSTGPQVIEGLSSLADVARRSNVLLTEIYDGDATNLNSAVGTPVTALTVAPHGMPDSSLNHTDLVFGRTGRPWLRRQGVEQLLAPVHNSAAVIGTTDPCSNFLELVANAHGWDLTAYRYPVLDLDDVRVREIPRSILPGGAVLSPRRWIVGNSSLRPVIETKGSARYFEWRRLAEVLRLPELVYVRASANTPEILIQCDSPMAVDAVLDRIPPDARSMVITELAGEPDDWPVMDQEGRHYLSELAVIWYDQDYWGRHAELPDASTQGVWDNPCADA